ncbi:MAG: signal peptidase II [Ruminococcaceae bacterium]|nr:signal peptidase II [Oscillospiraceae bacterium]
MTALIYTIIVAVLVAADQLTKRAVVTHMELNQTIPAIDGLLNWTYILNDGASFGMLSGKTTLLLITTGIVMAVLAFYLYSGRMTHITGKLSALLILAGGIGNCIDRVFNDGKVIDFIDIDPIFSFPKFNVADCCVTVGGVLFCVFMIFFCDDKKKITGTAAAAAGIAGELTVDINMETHVATKENVPAEEAVSEEAVSVEENTSDADNPAAE